MEFGFTASGNVPVIGTLNNCPSGGLSGSMASDDFDN